MNKLILFLSIVLSSTSLIGQHFRTSAKSSAIEVVDENSKYRYIDSLNNRAWRLKRKDSVEAERLANLSLTQAEKCNYSKGIGGAWKVRGVLEDINGRSSQAIEYYKESIEAFDLAGFIKEKAEVYLLWGNALGEQGDLDKAVEFYFKALAAAERVNCLDVKAIILNSIAGVKIKQDNLESADKIYQEALAMQEGQAPPHQLGVTYYRYASLLSMRSRLDSAMFYYKKAESIFNDLENYSFLAMVYGGQGNVKLQQGEVLNARHLYDESLALKQEYGKAKDLARSYYQIGNFFFEKKTFSIAKIYFQQCLAIADTLGVAGLKSKTLKALSNVYSGINDPVKALKFFQGHIAVRDTILNLQKEKEIKEIEEKYENEKLSRINEGQQAALKRNRISLGFLILISILIIRFYQQKRKHAAMLSIKKEELHEKELESVKQVSDLKSLNAVQDGLEMERKRIAEALHNSMGSLLSSIQMHLQSLGANFRLEKEQDKILMDRTTKLIIEAAESNRSIAYEMMPPVLIKFGLRAALDHLTDKLKIPGVKVNTDVYGMENRYSEKLELALYRIIDELINNILKHAAADEVTVQLTEHEDSLNILVVDNGKGFMFDWNNENYGMGLNNIRARINHFSGTMEVDSAPGKGTTINMEVPFV